ncbi:YhgE/Pip domain-containing protein [Streptomyces sp. NPDC059885]|uniref:YhgE/Pip domain-containing protein n=1 Tax=Streptomyces sp. NPDC059885 TaxID=3346988 RepID=UPI00365ECB3C
MWLAPSIVVTIVMAVLAAMYLGGMVSSSDDIDDFPIAIVNADAGVTNPAGQHVNVGGQIVDSLHKNVDGDVFDLRTLSLAEAKAEMGQARIYGAIVLPSDLSRKLAALSTEAMSDGAVARPEITVYTNQLASASIVTSFSDQALARANQTVGEQLITDATSPQATDTSRDRSLSGAAHLILSDPMNIQVTPFQSVPDGTGNGMSAMYYALLLVLAGFTGSLIASNFVDARLGFIPTEMGPIYRLEDNSGHSRLATLTMKWALMAGLAVVVSTVYLGVAAWSGMPLEHPWTLWMLSVLAITAVAVVVQSILALLGGLGMVVNLFLFIVLSVPSSGGTTPLEATPSFLRFLASFEPMHQIYLGTRSVLYFGATWDSGLGRAVIASVAALGLGIIVGCIGTRSYDRKGLLRRHTPATVQA